MQELNQKIHNFNTFSVDLASKRYFTIGQVANICNVKTHVLRYWEQEFNQLKPSKRRGNRRYYQRKDVEMVKRIYDLLYKKGYTISGARQFLLQDRKIIAVNKEDTAEKQTLKNSISELEQVLFNLQNNS